jgi:hypothetical protein
MLAAFKYSSKPLAGSAMRSSVPHCSYTNTSAVISHVSFIAAIQRLLLLCRTCNCTDMSAVISHISSIAAAAPHHLPSLSAVPFMLRRACSYTNTSAVISHIAAAPPHHLLCSLCCAALFALCCSYTNTSAVTTSASLLLLLTTSSVTCAAPRLQNKTATPTRLQ